MKVGGFDLNDDLGPQRDAQIIEMVLGGGAVLWPWVQVPLEDGRGYFEVASDYLAIGNDADWCRVPIGGPAAQIIADRTDSVLPTAFMVDLIWKHGGTKLEPKPFQDLTGMTTTRRIVEHQGIIERQREGRTGLVVGCKKDLIVSNRLLQFPTSVCIYGWHTAEGKPIQPVSTFHKQYWYCDYSHGIRFVKKSMVLDGQTVELERVWSDPRVAHVLTGGEKYAAATKQADAVLRVSRYNTALLSKGAPSTQTQQTSPTSTTSPPSPPGLVGQTDLGLRALKWCEQELAAGVGEEPPGSNAGPRIAQYFASARRRATGQSLGIDRGDWCAVAQSAALAAVARPDEPGPHGYRAAVWELEDDARESKAWVPAADIRSGQYALQPGDLVVWTRGQPGSRLGHVSRVQTPPDQNGDMMTIGGNESDGSEKDKWLNRRRNIKEDTFRGAIKYHDYLAVDFNGKTTPVQYVVPAAPARVVSKSETVMVPEKVLTSEGWLRFEEEYLPRVVSHLASVLLMLRGGKLLEARKVYRDAREVVEQVSVGEGLDHDKLNFPPLSKSTDTGAIDTLLPALIEPIWNAIRHLEEKFQWQKPLCVTVIDRRPDCMEIFIENEAIVNEAAFDETKTQRKRVGGMDATRALCHISKMATIGDPSIERREQTQFIRVIVRLHPQRLHEWMIENRRTRIEK